MSILREPLSAKLGRSLFEGGETSDARSESIAPSDGLSYVSGDRATPLIRKTIPQIFSETVKRHGPREAACFHEQKKRFSYYDLDQEVDRLACGLLSLGLDRGDRIGIWSPNRYEWLVTQFATARIGLIMVNINPSYQLAELEYALTKVGCKALIAAGGFRKADYIEMITKLAPELGNARPGRLHCARLPELRIVIRLDEDNTPGMFNYGQICEMGGPAQQLRLDAITKNLDPDDPINIQFTSGTTGAPKGATLTHFNIVNNAALTVETMDFKANDRLCIPVPLYHCFGMVLGTLGCVTKGASMVFPGEVFDAATTLEAVSGERCTALYGVPTMFIAMLEHEDFDKHDFSNLRTGMMAGAPCPVEVMRKVVRDMNMKQVTIGYGMTETSPISFQSAMDDGLEERVSTVGRIHPHVEVKIIDENGKTVSVGEQGELCTRGYSVMRGYWNDEERTQEAIDPAGWMHTGDLATLDERGYCRIVGRVKDMIIRGGENIYPREIEEFLYAHDKVAEVQVFGIPDDRYGEEVCAYIVLQPGQSATEDEIREFCKGQIAHFKIPRHIRFRKELPMTVTGKPQKFIMRDEMMSLLSKA